MLFEMTRRHARVAVYFGVIAEACVMIVTRGGSAAAVRRKRSPHLFRNASHSARERGSEIVSIGGVNHATGESRARVACRIGFQVVHFFMDDYRFSNDRIWTAQIEFPFPLEVPLAGSVSFNIAEIADVTLRPRRPVVVLMRRIEMRARRHRIRRRAIAFLVYVDTVLARFKVLDVSNDSNF